MHTKISKVVANKIQELKFHIDNSELTVNVHSFGVKRHNCFDNPGFLIESYRELFNEDTEEANNYIVKYFSTIEKYIGRLINPINDKPDYIQIFRTIDKRRNEIIKIFCNKMLENIEENKNLDYSDFFSKKNKNLSVTDKSKSEQEIFENFLYVKPKKVDRIKTLWIIDDTINVGSTIDAFLRNLYYKNLVDLNTKIYCLILYNQFKTDTCYKGMNTLNDYITKLNK